MAVRADLLQLQMGLMDRLVGSGSLLVAVIAQIRGRLDQAGRGLGMTGVTVQSIPVLAMGRLKVERLLGVTHGTGFHQGRQFMVAQRGERNHQIFSLM